MTPADARPGAARQAGSAGQADPAGQAGPAEEDRPGDAPCLLRRVCPACGAVADHDPPVTCPQCHTEITGWA